MPPTVKELLSEGTRRLTRVVKDNPKLAAEYILRSILKLRKIDLYLEPHREVTAGAAAEFWTKVGRKLEHEPLQYIIGSTEWYGLTIKCDKRALIPRPETEIITEKAIELIAGISQPRVADIGTGTGAIAVAIASSLENAEVIATDASEEALALARENIEYHGLQARVNLCHGDLLLPLEDSGVLDLIISNPPYIRESEYNNLMPEVREYEPKEALLAGADGLRVIEPLIEQSSANLRSGGWLVLEFGIDHARPMRSIISQLGTYSEPVIVVDYNGQDRGAIIQKL